MSAITLGYDFKGCGLMGLSDSKQSGEPDGSSGASALLRNIRNRCKKHRALTALLLIFIVSTVAYSFRSASTKLIQPSQVELTEQSPVMLPETKRQAAEKPLIAAADKSRQGQNALTSVADNKVQKQPEPRVAKKITGKKAADKKAISKQEKKVKTRKIANQKKKGQKIASVEKNNKNSKQVTNKKPDKNSKQNKLVVVLPAVSAHEESKAETAPLPAIVLAENRIEEKISGQILRQNTPEDQVSRQPETTDQEEKVIEVISGSTVIQIPTEQFLDENTLHSVSEEPQVTEKEAPETSTVNNEQTVSSEPGAGKHIPAAPINTGAEQVPVPKPEQIVEKIPEKNSAQPTQKTAPPIIADKVDKKTETTPPVAADKPAAVNQQKMVIDSTTTTPAPNFIKLDQAGAELAVTKPEWTCVKDSTNGLVWESKTNNGDLQDMNHSFTWFQTRTDPNDPSSILRSGVADGGRCNGGIACDTQSYVREMNAKKLCGYADWRLPTKAELLTLVMYQNDKAAASIDGQFFPHSVPSWYWTASSNEQREEYAWYVLFRNGIPLNDLKKRPKHIRLVRSTGKSPLHNREFAQE